MKSILDRLAELSPAQRRSLLDAMRSRGASGRAGMSAATQSESSPPGEPAAPGPVIVSSLGPKVPRYPAPLSLAQTVLIAELGDVAGQIEVQVSHLATFVLHGRLNVGLMRRAIRRVFHRHEILLTTFPLVDGQRRQVLLERMPAQLGGVVDLRGLPPAHRAFELARLRDQEVARKRDIARDVLAQVLIVLGGEKEHQLLYGLHPLVADDPSISRLLNELADEYNALADGQPAPPRQGGLQYADFCHWQREYLHGPALERHMAYWRQQLDGYVPSAVPLPPAPSAFVLLTVAGPLHAALRRLASEHGATLFMLLVAAVGMLVARCVQRSDVLICTPVSGRVPAQTVDMIGPFVNIVPIRARMGGGIGFIEHLGQVRRQVLDGHWFQLIPYRDIVRDCEERGGVLMPDLIVNWIEDHPQQQRIASLRLREISVRAAYRPSDPSDPLALFAVSRNDALELHLRHQPDLMVGANVRGMLEELQDLLERAVADPTASCETLAAPRLARPPAQ